MPVFFISRMGHVKDGKGKKYELIRGTIDAMMADNRIPKRRTKRGAVLKQSRMVRL